MLVLEIILILLVFILITDFTKNVCLVIKGAKGNTASQPDYLMILGYRILNNTIDATLRSRIDSAAEYLLAHPEVKAIPCGGITQKDQKRPEAHVIAEELIKKGVSEDRIILEDKSKTTEENFLNAKAIIDSMASSDTKKLAFLSSELHLHRAGRLAKEIGLEVTSLPAESPSDVKVKNYVREALILMYMDMMKLGGKKNG